MVFAVESGSRQAAYQQRDGDGIGVRRRRGVSGNRELIILARTGGAAAGGKTRGKREKEEGEIGGGPKNTWFVRSARRFGASLHES